MNYNPHIAYICMEFGIESNMKTYSGGLGILAGDTIKSYADMSIPAVGVGLLYKNGYLDQELDAERGQVTHPQTWNPDNYMKPIKRMHIPLHNQHVEVLIWEYTYTSPESGFSVSVLFLDTDHESNSEDIRRVSEKLYHNEKDIFYLQLMVLGLGSWYALQELGCEIDTYHLNESHSALLALVLNHRNTQVTFTTHTPVKGGHTRMPIDLIHNLCTENQCLSIPEKAIEGEVVNLTTVALELADYSNAVSEKHQEVTQHMFPDHEVDFITNGIHSSTWASPDMKKLFDTHIPGWREQPELLRHIQAVPSQEIQDAHAQSRKELHHFINQNTDIECIPDAFTIGFARRATAYKRAELLLKNPEHLLSLAHSKGGINVIFAGKAYHDDEEGGELIKRILDLQNHYSDSRLRIIYVENYDINLAKKLVSGVDVWLNTPKVAYEASGTSGMKAALNGVPNISVNDGWWIEGGIHEVTGWTIRGFSEEAEINSIHELVEHALSTYYYDPQTWAHMQRLAIAFVASYFNTHRMVTEYNQKGYTHEK